MIKVLLATRLIWPLLAYAGQEIHQTAGDLLVGGLQIQHHGALVVQMVGNGAGVLKPLGLDQHDLELGGRMDVDHLAVFLGSGFRVALLVLIHADAVVVVHHLRAVVHVLIVVIVLTAEKAFFQAIHKRHRFCSFHSGSAQPPGTPFAKELLIAFSIIGFFASDVNNYKSFPSYKFCPETIISS